MGRRPTSIVVTFLCAVAMLWAVRSSISLAQHTTTEPAAPAAITSEVLGRAAPVTAANPELSLGRETVMPGGVLPVHYHPGTQIGVVVQGELTHSVFTGEIDWHRGDVPAGEPYVIGPGEAVLVRPSNALVESPESIHQGRNDGADPLVIYLSTLFPTDAPRAIVVEATPVP